MGAFSSISLYDYLWFFLIYAFFGWCCEVVFCSVNTGKFVNRGFLNGPLCPIYGFGAVILVALLSPVQSVLLLYLASAVLCSLLELLAGFLLKSIFHTSWWDYSDQPLNIGGYICLKFSLLWGVAGVVLMRVIHPLFADLVAWIPFGVGRVALVVLYLLVLLDTAVTAVGVSKLNRDLREVTQLAQALRKGSEAMAEGLGNTAIAVAGKVEEMNLPAKKQQLADKLAQEREKLAGALAEGRQKAAAPGEDGMLQRQLQQLLQHTSPLRERLRRAFPDMKHTRYGEALRQWLASHNGKTPDDTTANTPDEPGENAAE